MESCSTMSTPPPDVSIPPRPADGHKGTFGRVAVVAGSRPFTGAPYLTASAALRGGAGQVRLLVGETIHPILAVKCTEVEVRPVPEGSPGALGPGSGPTIARTLEEWATVLVIGPGLGLDPGTAELVAGLVTHRLPTVIDADALNVMSELPELLAGLAAACPARILTPHPGEMARLLRRSVADIQADREGLAQEAARRWGAVVVLKGAHTVVASPDGRCSVDPHAVPALATGGTGDVLAGLIGALLAQGSDSFTAAVTGVFVHASAGRRVSEGLSSGVLASELLPMIPRAMHEVRQRQR